jgi:hypothetical protein
MRKRANALAVGQVDVSSGVDEQSDDFGVASIAAAEDDCLEQRGPPESVDVVDVDVGVEQALDDPDVTAVGGADEPGAVEAVVAVDVGAVGERQGE